jgi:dolichol-phosphate mannosyltransferase
MSDVPTDRADCPELSIVIPALNEQDNVGPLVEQVDQAVRHAGVDAELIVVDDGSTDDTWPRLVTLARRHHWLRPLRRDRAQGQSAAMHAGIAAARGRFVATLDADLQNDPADLPAMLERLRRDEADLVQGDRSRNRRDNLIRRVGSLVGRKARRWALGDPVRDTGCSARVMRASYARRLPLQFKGMHRFIPAYCRMLGARVVEVPVSHRPRTAGQTKYGLGVLNRGTAGLVDLLAVRWMIGRYRDPRVEAWPAAGQETAGPGDDAANSHPPA